MTTSSGEENSRPDVPARETIIVPVDRLEMLAGLGRFAIATGSPDEERAMLKTILDEFERWVLAQ
jgi:hypothetical protein